MKNLYDLLRQKESELVQLEKEVEALRLAARLLNEEGEVEDTSRAAAVPALPVITQPRPAAPVREVAPGWAETGLRQFP